MKCKEKIEWLLKNKVDGHFMIDYLEIPKNKDKYIFLDNVDVVNLGNNKQEIVDCFIQVLNVLFEEKVYYEAKVTLEGVVQIVHIAKMYIERRKSNVKKCVSEELRSSILEIYRNRYKSDIMPKDAVLVASEMKPSVGDGISKTPPKRTQKQIKDKKLDDAGGTRVAAKG